MTQAQTAPIEYTIYTFDPPLPRQKASYSWKKHATLNDLTNALDEARDLYATKKYQRIEIKKKFFDEKQNRLVDKTLKTFESDSRKRALNVFLEIFARSERIFTR